jgi:hypothetical protein
MAISGKHTQQDTPFFVSNHERATFLILGLFAMNAMKGY